MNPFHIVRVLLVAGSLSAPFARLSAQDAEVKAAIERVVPQVLAYRASRATFTLEFDRSHPVTVNDSALTARLVPTLERVLGRENVRRRPPITGAEDFSYFANEVPGFYFYLGAVPRGKKSGGHHTPTFYADDGAVPLGIRAMTSLVLGFLSQPQS